MILQTMKTMRIPREIFSLFVNFSHRDFALSQDEKIWICLLM
ncbi:hypothetical protein JCM19237_3264 [Photobacterium aphoticum]|uniref:Uncharacterized protein n=1 Tax=Photobacterium aphoticum TaxID=754436 RepID=A0A090QVT9_9GAMM|nr:hypothetical protein JCM19237_3264 [Photobacterium aphoticum]